MRMLNAAKKTCSVFTAVLLATSTISCFAAATKTGETPEEKMLNFGIIREEKPLEEEVTCAQYSAMLIRALGLDEVAVSYTDGDWSRGYMELAKKLRFYNSLSADMEAHQPISVEDAVVMTTAALGYDVMAEDTTAEQYGVGIRIGLYKNVSAAAKETLLRKDAYEIISNALETDLCVSENYSESGRYMIDKDNTLMDMLLELGDRVYHEGVVEASRALSLTGASVKDGEVMIDGVLYSAGDTDAENYVGSHVSFYAVYENDAEYGTIQWISFHRKNSLETLDEKMDKEIKGDALIYYPEETTAKSEKFSLDPSVQAVLNNRSLGRPAVSADLYDNRITLIDNDADDLYDVLLITQPESYLVKKCYPEQELISFESSSLYDKGGIQFEFDNHDCAYYFL